MIARTQLRLLAKHSNLLVWQAIAILDKQQKILDTRRSDATTLRLVHEVQMIETERCNNILKEII